MINEIVDNIPKILEFFLPGYLSIFAYRRLKSNNAIAMSENIQIGLAVCIIYIVRCLLRLMYYKLISKPEYSFMIGLNTPSLRVLLESLICLIIAVCMAIFRRFHWVRRVFSFVSGSLLEENVFEGCDLDRTVMASVYVSDKVVKGRVIAYGQEELDQWLVIDKYIIKDLNGNKLDCWYYHEYERYLIPIKDIKAVVIHYDSKSKMVPKNYQQFRFDAQADLQNMRVECSTTPKNNRK